MLDDCSPLARMEADLEMARTPQRANKDVRVERPLQIDGVHQLNQLLLEQHGHLEFLLKQSEKRIISAFKQTLQRTGYQAQASPPSVAWSDAQPSPPSVAWADDAPKEEPATLTKLCLEETQVLRHPLAAAAIADDSVKEDERDFSREEIQDGPEVVATTTSKTTRTTRRTQLAPDWQSRLVHKLNTAPSELSLQDVSDLFFLLDANADEYISKSEILSFIDEQVPDIFNRQKILAVIASTDINRDGQISRQEFHQKLRIKTDNEMKELRDLLAEKNTLVKSDGRCTGQQVIEYLRERKQTAAHCFSLPCNILFFLLTLTLCNLHLEIHQAYTLNQAMSAALSPINAPQQAPRSLDAFWDWSEAVLAPVVFATNGRIATHNQVIGGLLLDIEEAKPAVCHQTELQSVYATVADPCRSSDVAELSHWIPLLASDINRTGLATNNHTQKAATMSSPDPALHVVKRFDEIRNASATGSTEAVKISLLSYNAEAGFFTIWHLRFWIQTTGEWMLHEEFESFNAFPYNPLEFPAPLLVILDVLFVLMVIYFIYDELEDVWYSLKLRRNLLLYASIWNVIDWFKLVMSVVLVVYWWQVVGKTSALSELVLQFSTKPESGTARTIHTEVGYVSELLKYFRTLAVMFSAAIVLNFFKAFQANPRLHLVTQTITKAFSDLLHFGVVFVSTFLAFMLMGHLIFGTKTQEYAGILAAIDSTFKMFTGFMGPGDLKTSEEKTGKLWFLMLIIMMQFLLLNMVLAIIFDVYAEVKTGIGDAPTIWKQAREVFREKRERVKKFREMQMEALQAASGALHLDSVSNALHLDAVKSAASSVGSMGVQSVQRGSQLIEASGVVQRAKSVLPVPGMVPETSGELPLDGGEEVATESRALQVGNGNLARQPSKLGKMISETQILKILEAQIHGASNDIWDADILAAKIGDDMPREQARLLLEQVQQEAQRKEDQLDISLSDCCRLIGRVDANVREIVERLPDD